MSGSSNLVVGTKEGVNVETKQGEIVLNYSKGILVFECRSWPLTFVNQKQNLFC